MFRRLFFNAFICSIFVGCSLKVGPEKYLSSIENIQTELASRMHDIIKFSEDLDSAMLWQSLQQTSEYAEEAVLKVEELGPYRGDSLLMKTTLELLKVYRKALQQEILQMAKIVSQPGELSESDETRLQRLRRAVFNQLVEAERTFLKSANQFRREYIGMEFIEDESSTWFDEEEDSSGVWFN